MAKITVVKIQQGGITYAECGGSTGFVECGDTSEIIGDYWGVPEKGGGVFRGYNIQSAQGVAIPTPDSIPLVRLKDSLSGETVHILGTVAQFLASCADAGVTPMPLKTTIPVVIPEITACPDTDGNYTFYWTPPAKAGADEYRAHVLLDNAQAVAPLAGGHATIAAMVTWLNTNYAAAGTWTEVSGKVKLVRTSHAKVGLEFTVGNFT